MKVLILITCLLLIALVEADLNQPLVPIAAFLLMVLVLATLPVLIWDELALLDDTSEG